MDRKEESLIELRDVAVSAFLYASRLVTFIGRKRTHTGEVLFQFSPKNKAEELIAQYWRLDAPVVQPKLLFSAQRDLKDMIFGG